jgi:hypothetical protein
MGKFSAFKVCQQDLKIFFRTSKSFKTDTDHLFLAIRDEAFLKEPTYFIDRKNRYLLYIKAETEDESK